MRNLTPFRRKLVEHLKVCIGLGRGGLSGAESRPPPKQKKGLIMSNNIPEGLTALGEIVRGIIEELTLANFPCTDCEETTNDYGFCSIACEEQAWADAEREHDCENGACECGLSQEGEDARRKVMQSEPYKPEWSGTFFKAPTQNPWADEVACICNLYTPCVCDASF